MLNWCHHLPGAEGGFYALKGVRPDDEIAALPAAGFIIDKIEPLRVPELDGERHLVVISRQ